MNLWQRTRDMLPGHVAPCAYRAASFQLRPAGMPLRASQPHVHLRRGVGDAQRYPPSNCTIVYTSLLQQRRQKIFLPMILCSTSPGPTQVWSVVLHYTTSGAGSDFQPMCTRWWVHGPIQIHSICRWQACDLLHVGQVYQISSITN